MIELLSFQNTTLHIVNLFAAGMLVTAIVLQMQRGLPACIHLYVIQSFFLAAVSLTIALGFNEGHLLTAAVLTLVLKVFFIPAALFYVIKKIHIQREVQFYVNTLSSLLISGLLTALAFYLIYKTEAFASTLSQGAVAMALSLVFSGLFIMISRVKAITQLIGFLTMENGLFLLANVATLGIPFFIEVGIFFDVVVLLLIVGIFVFKMNTTFHHIDTTSLQKLREE